MNINILLTSPADLERSAHTRLLLSACLHRSLHEESFPSAAPDSPTETQTASTENPEEEEEDEETSRPAHAA